MKLLIATTNPDKFKEYQLLFKGSGLKLFNLPKLPRVVETGKTFKANVILKARAYGVKYSCPVLADDSGLEIKTLRGFPGIYSNRFAKGDFGRARKEILRRLKGASETRRRARFVCVIALYLPAKPIITFTGLVSGQIAASELGRHGFGYDSIFYLPRLKKTYGQMSASKKAESSHRSRAAKKLLKYLFGV